MDVSVVIPAYNEAERLPRLLDDLTHQRGVRPEIILADAHSTDGTREVATSYGATVVDGGMPAAGRNAGGRVAGGEVVVFLDADVRIPRSFLRNALREMEKKGAVVATCLAKPMSDLTADKVIHTIANLFVRMNQDRDPHAPGYCILVRRDVFHAIGGFDEDIEVAEDHDFVSRASRHGKFRFLDSTHVKVDVRRFEKEGRLGYSAKALQITLHRAIHGEITDSDAFEYEFGNYEAEDTSSRKKALRAVEQGLLKADHQVRKLENRLWSRRASAELQGQAERLFEDVTRRLQSAGRALFSLNTTDEERPNTEESGRQ